MEIKDAEAIKAAKLSSIAEKWLVKVVFFIYLMTVTVYYLVLTIMVMNTTVHHLIGAQI